MADRRSDLLLSAGGDLLGQQTPGVWNFGLSSIEKVGYQAQVIPALLAGLTLEFIETRLKRIVPDYPYLVVVPVCSLILAVFLAHTVIGPFGRMIGDGVAFAVRYMMTGSFAPIGAALFGFLYAPLVITGVHQTTLAIDMQMVQSMGGTPVRPLIAPRRPPPWWTSSFPAVNTMNARSPFLPPFPLILASLNRQCTVST